MCIAIICLPVFDVIHFKINHSFLIKPFSYMTKGQDKNSNILRAKGAFNMKWKSSFIIITGLSAARNRLRLKIGSLIQMCEVFSKIKKSVKLTYLCDALLDLVLFLRFKRREKHPWRNVSFSKVAGLKITLLHRCFSLFLNGTHGTKLRKASHITPQTFQKYGKTKSVTGNWTN